uniref:Probable (S)-N-methylcoclaurine 3'-hydroxylase isozyme 2 n=1 Tax=Tanacetum cinerariifolium TaxID=118510 RepID=A0A699HQD9_TANCI|nr:probable (S)-N-methylcoclaurine 3'-hydroxylase isozyme 2 [Tanacetum cinerariifolium]
MASKTILLTVASLIMNFEWFLPNNDIDPCDINMEEEMHAPMYKKEPLHLNGDKGNGKRIIKEVIVILDDDTSFDAPVFSNSDLSKDSHDYLSEDSNEDLINFLVVRDPQRQFPKQTQEERPKPLDVPMHTEEEDPVPLDIVYPHSEIASSSRGTNTRGQAHYGLRSLGPIREEIVMVKKP